jgi:hypothetical protein
VTETVKIAKTATVIVKIAAKTVVMAVISHAKAIVVAVAAKVMKAEPAG